MGSYGVVGLSSALGAFVALVRALQYGGGAGPASNKTGELRSASRAITHRCIPSSGNASLAQVAWFTGVWAVGGRGVEVAGGCLRSLRDVIQRASRIGLVHRLAGAGTRVCDKGSAARRARIIAIRWG